MGRGAGLGRVRNFPESLAPARAPPPHAHTRASRGGNPSGSRFLRTPAPRQPPSPVRGRGGRPGARAGDVGVRPRSCSLHPPPPHPPPARDGRGGAGGAVRVPKGRAGPGTVAGPVQAQPHLHLLPVYVVGGPAPLEGCRTTWTHPRVRARKIHYGKIPNLDERRGGRSLLIHP
ncbi:proline-rich transmembrane protein 1-like [Mustela erminea]|uniref:proline-rich transmembrane protein 1-like n=1 Tax=Mustela erminea TaxID=36723 RepID=UPI0013871B77|nr:proline-rich transmembrane protein 1-like [Mustela erminea]